MSGYDPYDLADDVERLLRAAGYVVYNGDAETGEAVDDCSGEDFWFTWTDGKCDIEVGEAMPSDLAAWSDALEHFFTNAVIDKEAQE